MIKQANTVSLLSLADVMEKQAAKSIKDQVNDIIKNAPQLQSGHSSRLWDIVPIVGPAIKSIMDNDAVRGKNLLTGEDQSNSRVLRTAARGLAESLFGTVAGAGAGAFHGKALSAGTISALNKSKAFNKILDTVAKQGKKGKFYKDKFKHMAKNPWDRSPIGFKNGAKFGGSLGFLLGGVHGSATAGANADKVLDDIIKANKKTAIELGANAVQTGNLDSLKEYLNLK